MTGLSDEEFLGSAPAPQGGLSDEEFMGAQSNQPPAANAPQAKTSALSDVGKTIAGNAAKGASYLATSSPASLASDVIHNTVEPVVSGATRLAGEAYQGMGGELSPGAAKILTDPIPEFGQTPEQSILRKIAQGGIQNATGADANYQPSTPAGKVTNTALNVAPYLAGGEGGVLQKIGQSAGAGIGSETGRETAENMGFGEQGQQVAQVLGGGAGIMGAKGAGEIGQTASDSMAASRDANVAAKPAAYDPVATHSAISDAYGKAKANAAPYYNFMRDIASGETADASGLKPALDSMIADIQNTPFHEASSELQYLIKQSEKLGESGNMPLNDMVKLKQNLNSNFNPKRFAIGSDTPYANVASIVDDSLEDAGQRIPEFAQAKSLADKNWLNTVENPFQNNPVLSKFWKPEDYYAKKSVDSGMLEELPDATQQRAATMMQNIKNPVQLNAVRRVLPDDLAGNLSRAKVADINAGNSTIGQLGKAAWNAGNTQFSSAAKNLYNAVKPDISPQDKALIQAANAPSPNLSTKYQKPFQDLKASQQQLNDLAGEMQPMNYAAKEPPRLALPAPEPYSVSGKGIATTPAQRGSGNIMEINTGAKPPPVTPVPDSPMLALPAPKPISVSGKGIATTPAQQGTRAITEINKGAKPYPLNYTPEPAAPAAPQVQNWENPLVPHMEGVVSELQNAANGQRYFDYSKDGQSGTPDVMGMKSQNPDWFQTYNKNNPTNTITKKYVLDTFNKMKAGAQLGAKEQSVADMIRSEGVSRLEQDMAQRRQAVENAKSNPDDPNHEHAVINDDVPFASGGAVKKPSSILTRFKKPVTNAKFLDKFKKYA